VLQSVGSTAKQVVLLFYKVSEPICVLLVIHAVHIGSNDTLLKKFHKVPTKRILWFIFEIKQLRGQTER
jgi:hypothetical protein